MALKFGLNTGPQDTSIAELQALWRRAEAAGFWWVSVWDHFYANPFRDRTAPCFEGTAILAALAAATRRVRVGCLVFAMPFRHPAQLAEAVATIDHLSGGRVEMGLGAGWLKQEFEDLGLAFGSLRERMDRLEEGLQVVRSLFRDEQTNFEGRYYSLRDAVCAPRPLQPRLRLWVGGAGPTRTPRLAALYADGFNTPFVSPAICRERNAAVDAECERIGRDPAEILRSANVGFYLTADAAQDDLARPALARLSDGQREGSLVGGVQQVVDRVGEYSRAGISGLNISVRPPVDTEALEAFIADVMPQFA